MTRTAVHTLVVAVAALIVGASAVDAHHSSTVQAPILKGIDVDGRLDDWPASLTRYSFDRADWSSQMRTAYSSQHRPGAYFMTGYDPEGVLYVAVQVADEDLVIGDAWNGTDGVEVYVVHQGPRMPVTGLGMFRRNPIQYVMIPVPGSGGVPSSGHGVRWPHSTTHGEYSYEDGVITYEWAIQVSDRFGGDTTPLSPGDELAFDVVILDQPSHGSHRWIPWGSPEISKFTSLDRVGRVTLTDDVAAAPGWSATAPTASDSPWPGILLSWLLPLGFVTVVGRIVMKREARRPAERPQTLERIEEIERRLTDTQDILLSISDKLDGGKGADKV
ncbi:MAG: hypothetical protein HOH74_26220 [Gemmatimonadetes bacterium]|jgi:hypothetical protein|nr:hypothetical protein [Gemmatimonadota bacterium]